MSFAWTTFATNLAMTAVMAIIVALASQLPAVRYRPRLRYGLWFLVLAKLVMLPLIDLPVLPAVAPANSLFNHASSSDVRSALETGSPHEDSVLVDWATAESLRRPTTTEKSIPRPDTFAKIAKSGIEKNEGVVLPSDHSAAPSRVNWWFVLGAFLVTPSAIVLGLSLWQVRRAEQLICRAEPAGRHLVQIVADASRRMGLAKVPGVCVVSGRLTPLVWMGRMGAVIVLPAGLLERLDGKQLDCVIGHELAHLIRRDHWANAFAQLVAALYWWFPFAWWARRELLSAQEECCDALAISNSPSARRRYAETLFTTIEFINDERPLSPALASGFGRASSLRRRFEMIAGPKLSRWTVGLAVPLVLVVGAAFCCLPVRGQAPANILVETSPPNTKETGSHMRLSKDSEAKPGGKTQFEWKQSNGEVSYVGTGVISLELGDGKSGQKMIGTWLPSGSPPAPTVQKTALEYHSTAEVTVDPKKHCVYVGEPAFENCQNGALRVNLEKGVKYTVRASGEAFMSKETGEWADPYPGVFVGYASDEEDCNAARYTILKPGDSITFTTPSCLAPQEEVFLTAFFVHMWPPISKTHAVQRGSYTLTFTRASDDKQQAASPVTELRLDNVQLVFPKSK